MREGLRPGTYRAVIDSALEPGSLTYGELILPGESTDEVFLSTYVCHPSMANNELSGPVVATGLARWLMQLPDRHYTYRIAFTPESIGAITYASRNLDALRDNVIAGFQLTCIGDDRRLHLPGLPTRQHADRPHRQAGPRHPRERRHVLLPRTRQR